MTEQDHTSGFSRFVAEMRRRHVVRFALGYAAAAFVVLQLAEIVFPAFGLGESSLRLLVVVVALGFPPATVLAWVFDITVDGIRRTEGRGPDGFIPRLVLLGVTIAIVSGLGFWLTARGVFDTPLAVEAGTPVLELAEYDPSVKIMSIAVLPLDDFSEDGSQAYFTSGMHEELIAKLSQVAGLRVVSRTSVTQYASTSKSAPQIGRELRVDALIEGSVSRAGDDVRVTLQIIHAPSDSHIQTLQFDRTVTNIFELQSEIAHAVVSEIEGDHDESEISRLAMNVEPDAQEAYLRGKFEYGRGTPEGYQAALEYFEDAVDRDPDFANALAGVAGARFLVHIESGEIDPAEMERARIEAARALQMDSGSVEAMEVVTFIERSVPLIPAPPGPDGGPGVRVTDVGDVADSVAMLLGDVGADWELALTTLGQRLEQMGRRRSSDAEMTASEQQTMAARQLIGAGRFGDAASILRDVLANEGRAGPVWELLVRAEVSEGDVHEVVAAVRDWSESGAVGAPDVGSVRSLETAVERDGLDGYWTWSLSRLESVIASGVAVPHTNRAAALAGTGDHEAAFQELEAAIAARERGLQTLRTDPVWDALRGDSRFVELEGQARRIRFSPRSPGGRGRVSPGGRGN